MNLLQFLSAAAGEPLNRWLLDVAVRSTLLLLIAAGTILALRRISAAGRHFLWGLGLICSLLLPFVVAITPAIQWKIIPAAVQPVSDSHSTGQNSELTAQVLRPRTANFGTPPTPLERIPESLTGALADNRPLSLPPTAPAKSRSAIVLSSKLPWILWAIGAMVTGAYFAAGWVGILRLCRKLEPIRDEECSRHAQQFAASAGLRATPLLMQSREVGVPFTLGCNSGVIVLPRGWTEWTVERRRFVLMHEIAHIRRHDWLTQWLGWLAATVYWFNPVVWSAVKQVRIEAEKACDDAVLRAGHAASDYAEELLAIAAALPSARTPIPPAIPMAQRAKFEERIQSILNARVNRSPSSKVLVVGSVLGVMLLLPVLAAVEITTKVEAAAAAPSLAEDTKTTSSSVPLKDSIRSVSGKVSIEILFLGSDNIVNGLLSPDGKKIAFMDWEWRKPNYKKHDLIVRNLATGQEVPVTQKAGGNPEVYELASFAYFGSGPGCWSPDSQWVSYVWYTDQYLMNNKSGASTELRIAKADGSESKVLKDEDHWRPYAWSPDGRHLLCDFSRR
ncbi:MAG: hypothetical protein HY735_36295, partial [Verrucomicrobia bacterium]|nr:hypothetical protein [Verrucomicrobiota bacterium]